MTPAKRIPKITKHPTSKYVEMLHSAACGEHRTKTGSSGILLDTLTRSYAKSY